MSFYNLTFLVLLTLIPLFLALAHYRDIVRKRTREKFAPEPLITRYSVLEPSRRATIRNILIALGASMLLIAFARPQGGESVLEEDVEGIDIVLAIDVSRSMLAQDIKPNRLNAIKKVVNDFINSSYGDRIGVVAFAGEAIVICPITNDHGSVLSFIDRLDTNEPIRPGTAIGDAIKMSVNRFRDDDTGKVVILLTDGESNKGINPVDAAKEAKEAGVRIYTVGIGTPDGAPLPEANMNNIFGRPVFRNDPDGNPIRVGLDEKTLKSIAEITDGKYFTVANQAELNTLYGRISREGETKFQTRKLVRKDELAPYFLLIGCLLLIMEAFYAYMAPGEAIKVAKK